VQDVATQHFSEGRFKGGFMIIAALLLLASLLVVVTQVFE